MYDKGDEKRQLTSLRNKSDFSRILEKIIVGNTDISFKDKEFILYNAIILFKYYDADRRYKNYFKLAYYIILKYSILFDDYRPLYDLSIQIGFYPICKTIIEKELIEFKNISSLVSQELIEIKFQNSREKYIETFEQSFSIKKLLRNPKQNLAYIAPTSFGKSSLINDFIINKNYKKIGIIVPSKSLLIQTYKGIKELKLPYKLLLHDEMYNNNEKFIGILTQERATRLLKRNVFFDILFIDEAHNILKYNTENTRGVILARLIQKNKLLNPNQKVVYLSPLVDETKNIFIEKEEHTFTQRVELNLKSEDILLYENNEIFIYNKYLDKYYRINNNVKYYDYIISNSLSKNFIYNFRPINIEEIAKQLYDELPNIPLSGELKKIILTLKNEVHDLFFVNQYIEKGIVYIHGKIPNLIKEYLEYKFKEIADLKYIIANSVILEGINLPIDTLFITSTKYLQGKDIENLIGRVNRLNYIFTEKNIKKLNPKIHFLNHKIFQGNDSIRNKIKLLRNHSFGDKIENPLLSEYDIEKLKLQKTKFKSKEEVIRNRKRKDKQIIDYTNFILNNDNILSESDKVKKYLIENGINNFYNDFQIISNIISKRIQAFKVDNNFLKLNIIDKIYKLLIENIEDKVIDYEIERLKNEKARAYYKYYIEKTQKQSLNQNIKETTTYFKKKAKSFDSLLFIGRSFGKVKRPSKNYNSKKYMDTVYFDLYGQSEKTLINLAIIKLKIEEDFVSFKLNKLIILLYDYELITKTEFYLHIYGTDDTNLIKLARMGLNLNLITKLTNDKQFNNIKVDINGNLKANSDFREYLVNQPELFKFEINKYL